LINKKYGVAAQLKNKVRGFRGLSSFFSFHCMLHQEALCAKSLHMNHVMGIVNTICADAIYRKEESG
jgi:hypothetical protein